MFVLFLFFWVVFWTVVAVQWPSRRLHRRRLFFYPLTGTEHGSQPSLTTRDRELDSVLKVRIEPGDLNPRPLTPQSVTLPTLPRAGLIFAVWYSRQTWMVLGQRSSTIDFINHWLHKVSEYETLLLQWANAMFIVNIVWWSEAIYYLYTCISNWYL